jgi:fluoride ion exporter CrcB/FEX
MPTNIVSMTDIKEGNNSSSSSPLTGIVDHRDVVAGATSTDGIDYAASALSSPSDEQKEKYTTTSRTSQPPMMTTLLTTILSDQQQEQEQYQQQEKQSEGEGENALLYHSIPESGNALNVGYNTDTNNHTLILPNNDSNGNTDKSVATTTTQWQISTIGSGSYVTAMEQEQTQTSNITFQSNQQQQHQHQHQQQQQQQQQHQPFETDNDGDNNNSNGNGISSSKSFVDTLKQAASNTTNSVIWWTMSHFNCSNNNTTSSASTSTSTSVSQRRKVFVQACYLGIGAIFGTLLRLILAQLFGQACSNPGTIGYINDEAVLCVTSNGETTQNEGIIFADLPANLLGSFIMGLLQDGTSLGLAINMPIAFIKPTNIFQSYDIWHLALKTGFCGSLTTFSAWNSEMVILLVGNHTNVMSNHHSMIWKALFGYVIGIETAIGSYVFGRTVAWWFHRWMNPQLAYEQREMNIREKKHGIVINRTLPILERQYLHRLFENNNNSSINININNSNNNGDGTSNSLLSSSSSSSSYVLSPASTLTQEEIEPLYRWRESTNVARRVESGDEINKKLVELETSLIVRKESITHEQLDTALYYDWDIDALQTWLMKRNKYYNHQDTNESSSSLPSSSSVSVPVSLTPAGISKTMSEDDTVWYAAPVACMLLILCLLILIILMMHWDAQTSYEITYRTMAYSMLFAPPGALLRWKLSGWNGNLGTLIPIPRLVRWKWLPVGTLAANVLGAMISITMIGWEYNIGAAGSSGGFTSSGFWGIATIRAIKIGFSGCLSTVSTFVSEVHKLTQIRQDRGYKYILITLVLSAVLSMILFVIIV